MPTYEYVCKKCGKHLEVVQSFYDDPLTVCDTCGGELRKVFGNIGIVFKGSGFYKTDSRGTASATTPSTSTAQESTAKSGTDNSKAPSTEPSASTTPAKSTTPKAEKGADKKGSDKKGSDSAA
ncbi:FmdB family zinc ribbon protein [Ferrimicrobium sp.]|uniref:FmdB family zinc ribbon protein n=1 Tax=Ferrimicrobium sp. TaxID=2926050 RepID=UPI002602956E|nr:FmdB family zinc ribbon protein [Ferrimicrobium sp.]